MNLLNQLWNDESGAILSAEMVTVGTVAVLGTTVGLGTLGTAVNEELVDVAKGIRSLDQSYAIQGLSGSRAWTAGSSYQQRPVAESLAALGVSGRAPDAADHPVKGDKTPVIVPADDVTPAAPAPTAPVTVTPAEKKLNPSTKTKKN